jgi:hypothetical protein
VGIDLTYSMLDAGRAEAEARLDLRAASLSVKEAGWTKPPGTPGTARLVVDFADDRVTRLREIEARAPGLYGKFSLALAPDTERIERADIERLVIGDDNLVGIVALRPGAAGGSMFAVRGSTSLTGCASRAPLRPTARRCRSMRGSAG